MERDEIIGALLCLNKNNPLDCNGDIHQLLESNLKLANEKFNIVSIPTPNISFFDQDDDSPIWHYLTTNFHFIFKLKSTLENSPVHDVLSVQQTKSLKSILKQVIGLGVRHNLLPNMPQFIKFTYTEDNLIMKHYNRLAATIFNLFDCLKCVKLRAVILQDNLQAILNGLYQILYCPLKKPSSSYNENFKMTSEFYERIIKEKEYFKGFLDYLVAILPKKIYTKETMLLLENNNSLWFKKAISGNLTKVLRSEKGLETIAVALLENSADYDPNDTTKTWKALDILVKLVMSLWNCDDFESNICKQIGDLVNCAENRAFEMIFLACTKTVYKMDERICRKQFLSVLLNTLINLTNITCEYKDGFDITESLQRTIRLLHSGFLGNNINDPDLPLGILTPIINVIFNLYSIIRSSGKSQHLQNQLREILIAHIKSNKSDLYDAILFGIHNEILIPKYNFKIEGEKIKIANLENKDINKCSGDIFNLLNGDDELLMGFFIYLLGCLNDKEKYFKDLPFNDSIERNLLVYNLLSNLSEDKRIQKGINQNPIQVINYINTVLKRDIQLNTHISEQIEADNFQNMFLMIMILQALILNCDRDKLQNYTELNDTLKMILAQCVNEELRQLVSGIMQMMEKSGESQGCKVQEINELEQALQDICDPLLPVRGHGLMTLAKLIENKDEDALKRKMYILNVFQQNIKNDDSFIYLSAINGLAAMGDLFPEIVLNILTEEYADMNREEANGNELRMKLGEVLVRVTKKLGNSTTKYKSLLLNTFLSTTKDDDHLIRASSLSNLGEICRVLGYKLGSIVTEVLECIHAIITRDKAVEARRAAVTVIRQLFIGLEAETVTFLKEEILEIYKTLKNIYKNDEDEVMKLQAQLALEELNENIKKFLFSYPHLME